MKKNAPQGPIRRKLAAIAVAACFAAPGALANPTGANVVRGTAAIHQTGNLLQITNSPNAIINWQSFSIGANEITRFLQQSPSSAVLNRVTTQNPSQILGALQSNGRVFLINPNGILFGAGAQVDVAGLVASTLNLSDQDFLAGRLRFSDGLGKSVVNDGSIATGPGGSVYLIGSGVANNGLIRSPQGEVVLAAGNSVELVSPGTPNLRVEITATDNEARNLGQIISEAGRIGIYAGLINQSGTIRADSAVAEGGRILLKATKSLTLEAGSVTSASGPSGGRISIQSGDTTLVSGTVEATGSEGNGGRIELLGERVGLINAAELDVSGRAGGGTVLVGGDFQGGNPDVQNASRTYVGREVEIRADASQEGDGGKVVVWADGDTRYYGSISARGGASAGDGGSVEVSGKQHLDFHGRVDVAAPNGTGGNVLLDPQDIVLNTTAQPSPPNNAIGTPDVAFATPPDPGTYTIQIADVTGYAELYLQATRDITVSSALTMGAGNTIRFEANNNININAALTTSGTPSTARPSITLTADADASGAGTLTLAVGANLTAQQGGISLSGAAITGAGNLNATGAAGNNGGNISVTATGAVNLTGTITASGGGAGGGTGRNGGTVTITGAGISTAAITANGTAGAAGLAGGAGGTIQLDSSNGMTTGALAASGGAAGAGSASGGAGGTIVVSNTTAGNVTTGALTARAGAGTGTALSSAGSISATNDAAGASLQTGAIDTRGNNNGAGGAVSLSSQAALQFGAAATIFTSGGAALAGTAGQSGGVVSLTGATVTTTGAITTSGAAGNAANQAGGNAGAITVTANGAINVSAGTLTASGGNAGGGNANGGNGGAVTLDADATSTITLANITTTGGNRAGTGTAGAGGSITVADAALLGANTTITATGGSAGLGAGGSVSFSGTLDSSGASRTLAVNTNGATVFGDAVGGTLALTSLTTNATGTTSLGGDVTTTGVQSYGDAVTLTGNATLTGTTPTFSSTVNGGGFDLALNFSGTTTVNGATFTSIRNLATGNGGTTNLTGSITTTGTQTYDDAVTLTGATTLASGNTAIAFNSTVNGGQTLVVNTTGATTFGGNVGSTTALTSVTTNTGGTTSIGGNVTTTGAQAFNDAVTLAGGGTRTFASTANNAIAFNSTVDGGSGLVANTTGATTFAGVVGGLTPLTSLTTNAGGTTAINGGAVTTSGAQSYNDATTLGGATTLRTTAAGGITAAGVVTATAGTLTLDTGSGAATFNNPANNFGTVAITSSGTVSLVDANALTLAGGSVDSIQARSLSGNLTVSAGITAAGAGNSIVLVAAQDFVNGAGAGALNPGPGRWLVYSASPAGSIENGLTGAAGSALPRLYNRTFGANPPASITEPGNHLIYSSQPALAVAPDNKTKVYGTNDPAQTFVALGFVNDDGVLDTVATAGLTGSFGRVVGEGVGTRLIAQGTFTSDAGYSITFDGTRTLTITPAALTGTIASQSKVYGANDPALAGIAVNLAGVVNTSVADWNGNVTAINDTGNVNATLASLTRAAGETVGASPYAITGGTLNALTGSAAGNYSANLSTAGNTLAITPAALTGTIANQSKVYGANDPALAGIAVNLTGLVNNPAIVTWNGNVSVNDTGNVNAALASLTRAAGETVTGSPYAITGGTLNALTGSAAGNYTASLSTAGNTLAITPAALTGTIANQAKIYGADDPALAGIPVILTGLVNNPAIVTWNGNVAIDDSALTSSVTSLARTVGEGVGGYNITAGTLSAPSGNYSAPTFTGTPTLTINAAPLSFALTTPGQTKVYGADDPALGGIAVTLTGLVNNPAIVTWNGTVAVDDSAVTGTLTSLTRAVGETVAASPYAITAGAVTLSASNANYAKSFDATNSPQLAITPAGLSVTANAQSKGYGAADPALTFGVAGLVNATVTDWNGNGTLLNDTVASVFGGTLNRAAGETVTGSPYAITQGTLAANANYNLTTFTGSSLTITPAPLTITADDAMRPVNQPNPPFSAAYSGFQFGETPAALTGTLSFTTPATTGSPAGIYSITPFGQSSTNYVISYLDGALTVSTAIVPPLTSASLPDPVVASLGQLGMSEPYAKSVGCAAGHATIGAPGDCGGGSVVVAISRQPRGGIRFGPNGEISLEPGLKLHIAPTVDMGALRGASLPNPPAVETNSRPGVGLQITPTLTNRP